MKNAFMGLLGLTCAIATSLGGEYAIAADYPAKPVTSIVPFAAGGATDTIVRLYAQALTERTGQQFLVENLPGGNAIVGTAAGAAKPADGYYLMSASPSALIQNPYLFGDIGYTIDSFEPFARLVDFDFVAIVRTSLNIKSFQELLAYSKEKPGELNYGTPGVGNPAHQTGELLKLRTGLDITHVPYSGGGAQTIAALLAGEVDVLFPTVSEALPYIRSGDAVAVAMLGKKRAAVLPDVPTLAEVGVKDVVLTGWMGLFAPKGSPKEAAAFINKEVSAILKETDVRAKLQEMGFDVTDQTPEEMAADLRGQEALLRELIDLTGGPQKK